MTTPAVLPFVTMPLPEHALLHSVSYVDRPNNHSALIAVIKHVITGDSKLMILRDPQRPFWVTKPMLRGFTYKPSTANLSTLDCFQTTEHDLPFMLQQALGQRPQVGRKPYLRGLCDSPYVFGADIPLAVIYKEQMQRSCSRPASGFRVGALDLETSLLGGNEIIVGSYTSPEGTTYCGVYQPFMKGATVEELETKCARAQAEMEAALTPKARAAYNKYKWPVVFKLFTEEMGLVRWLIQQVHLTKPDFVGIWKLDYDIPYIFERLAFHRQDPMELFCHPDVPRGYRICEFKPDKREDVEHFVDRWHWFHLSGYTQFYDAMCLYGRNRKASGREISYGLDYIARKQLGVGKLSFGANGTHPDMQQHHFTDYVVYGAIDSILVRLLDMVTRDVEQLVALTGVGLLENYAMQTKLLHQAYYAFGLKSSPPFVPCAIGRTMAADTDDQLANVGGAVLDPTLAVDTGINVIRGLGEASERLGLTQTYGLHKCVADIDGTSLYPSITRGANVDRDTKTATIIAIEDVPDPDIEDFCANVASVEENVVYIGSRYFGLPNHQKLLEMWDESQANPT